MSARNHEVTAKQQLLDANGNIAETVLDAFPMGKLQMPTILQRAILFMRRRICG